MNILDQIITRKKEEVIFSKSKISVSELKSTEFYSRETFSLKDSLLKSSGIIAEFKRHSPSKGIINDRSEVLDVVQSYQKFGASGISILTDQDFFRGSFLDIISVRNEIKISILRKDFMIDEYQFYEAKSIGADAVLLIASCLSPSQVVEFTDLSHELGLEVLLEIHKEKELNHFNKNIDLVGINNRNLKDFKVDLQHSAYLKDLLPKEALAIAESGIYSLDDYQFLKEKGFEGFLMGEYYMKNEHPGLAFEKFINEIYL